jgi:hypothetical protein
MSKEKEFNNEQAIEFAKEYLEKDEFVEFERLTAVPTEAIKIDLDPLERQIIIQNKLEECRNGIVKMFLEKIIPSLFGVGLD